TPPFARSTPPIPGSTATFSNCAATFFKGVTPLSKPAPPFAKRLPPFSERQRRFSNCATTLAREGAALGASTSAEKNRAGFSRNPLCLFSTVGCLLVHAAHAAAARSCWRRLVF